MDLAIMKKKLNSFKKPNGSLRGISDDMLVEVLRTWEGYTGPMDDFARQIGVRKTQIGPIIHKARKIAKASESVEGGFREIRVSDDTAAISHSGIELILDHGKVLRFSEVDVLLDFLKKVA